jgi:hypothetical protein
MPALRGEAVAMTDLAAAADVTAESLAAALASIAAPVKSLVPAVLTVHHVIPHPGFDGYIVSKPMITFVGLVRHILAECHRVGWPRPEAVKRAEVSIVAHGTERCGPKTLAHVAGFFAKHLYAGAEAVTMGEVVMVKAGPPRIEVTVRAIEIVQIEDPGDKAARLAREMPSPIMHPDGSYDGELQVGETPAFVHGQGFATPREADERLDRIERSAQPDIPDEQKADPPSIRNAEDPEAVVAAWSSLVNKREGVIPGGSSSKSAIKKVINNPMCECGHRAMQHTEHGSCKTCSCERYMTPGGAIEEKRVPMNVPISPTAKKALQLYPGTATELLEKHAQELLDAAE